ncbi:uncharacterized protein LOC136092033 [Hydra vulgaris]|uniref:Uncharacterized protein LOC136092033 n=1 Tax=Hydra vulgaris TaxID=6087 RepID=A0ABM4DMN7_HYDVU
MDLAARMKKNETVNKCNLKKFKLEVEYWQNILKRIISVSLASYNLAFQGHTDNLFSKGNGNFLGLIDIISEFDPILQEHLRKIKLHEVSDHSLGKNIQNQIIQLLGSEIKKSITLNCQNAKYYSIIMDCITDLTHPEQITLVLRFYNCKLFAVEEYFIGFVDYVGRFFVPCSAQSLNLIVYVAAKSSSKAVSFFGLVQEVYNFFSGSYIRWAILMKSVQTLTLKPLSDTRWESRVESLKTLKYEYSKVYDALIEIANSSKYDTSTKFQANNLAKQMSNFTFMLSLIVWYDILFQVNLVSKKKQSPDYDLSTAQTEIDQLLKYFNDFCDKGIKDAKLFAMEIAEELEVSPQFEAENTVRP